MTTLPDTCTRFNKGTLVSVLASYFNDHFKDDPRWSSKLSNDSRQELFGVIDKAYASRCEVFFYDVFFDDKVTTMVELQNLIVKSNQELVILHDGSEWKREGFCRLVPLDGVHSDEAQKQHNGMDESRSLQSNGSTSDSGKSSKEDLNNSTTIKRKRKNADSLKHNSTPSKRCASGSDAGMNTVVTSISQDMHCTCTVPAEPSSKPNQTERPKVAIHTPHTSPTSSISETTQPAQTSPTSLTSEPIQPPQTAPISLKSRDKQTSPSKDPKTQVKKAQTKKRLVKTLAEAEEKSSYDSTSQENTPERTVTVVIKPGHSEDRPRRTLHYSTKRHSGKERRNCVMMVGKPGPTDEVKEIVEPLQAFDYYFPPELQEKLVSFVNKRIVATLKQQYNKGEENLTS